jgi:hypothetical protein
MNRQLVADAKRIQLRKDLVEAVVVRRRGRARLTVTAPENCDFVSSRDAIARAIRDCTCSIAT